EVGAGVRESGLPPPKHLALSLEQVKLAGGLLLLNEKAVAHIRRRKRIKRARLGALCESFEGIFGHGARVVRSFPLLFEHRRNLSGQRIPAARVGEIRNASDQRDVAPLSAVERQPVSRAGRQE